MDQKYRVVFSGKILPGFTDEEVRAKLSGIFKGHTDQIDLLFVGGPVVVKGKVDGATAEKYRAAFASAGAQCDIIEIGEAPQVSPVADPPEADPVAESSLEDVSGADPDPIDTPVTDPAPVVVNRDKGLSPDAPGSTPCAECDIRFYRGEMISCYDKWVCETCEPVFAQKCRKNKSARGSKNSGLWSLLKEKFSR